MIFFDSYVIGFPPVLSGCCHFKIADDFRTSITSRVPFGDSGTSGKKICKRLSVLAIMLLI